MTEPGANVQQGGFFFVQSAFLKDYRVRLNSE